MGQRRKRRVALRQGALLAFMALMTLLWLGTLLPAPFHEDEAIYAAWSLAILRGDPWLWQTPVDKPPLTFYPIALSVALFGRHEWAARLPNLLWTLLLLGTIWRIARHRDRPGWLALLFALLSPLLWALAASAFTDMAMVALAFLALERAMQEEAEQAGLAFALALLAKPTALFLAPLLLLPLFTSDSRGTPRFFLACAAPLLLAWAWDASREAPSWWALGSQAYGTLGSVGGQWRAWGAIAAASLGWLLLIGGLVALLGADRVKGARLRLTEARFHAWPLLLAAMLLGWIPFHVLLGMQPWERYLLPLVPIAALLWAELCPLRALGVPPAWLRGVSGTPLPQPLSLHLPVLPPLPLPSDFNRQARVGYPSGRLYLVGGFFALFLLLVPALVRQYQLEPHDGRWEGIAEMGATIERLPAGATVFYLDTGRPLAWYAADAQARLLWGGSSEAELRESLARESGTQRYLLLTHASLNGLAAGWTRVAESAGFVLLAAPPPAGGVE